MNEPNYTYLRVQHIETDNNGNPLKIQLASPDISTPDDKTITEQRTDDIKSFGLNCYNTFDENFNFNSIFNEDDNPKITIIKMEQYDDYSTVNYTTQIDASVNNDPNIPQYIYKETDSNIKIQQLNLPQTPSIRCQNCDTYFITKYQYQRHQCEFNAEKVVLKPEVSGKDIHTAIRSKYECETCKKTFISITNLERHKQAHISTGSNTCEYCNKTFVSESRLLTHKANHCKKSGEVTKFYRSDVAVWRCVQCDQVFSSENNGNEHIRICLGSENGCKYIKMEKENIPTENVCDNNHDFDTNFARAIKLQPTLFENYIHVKPNLEKIVTETLYQCEFCNRTYATKVSVKNHQKTHTTQKNYECISCFAVFTSYCDATIHWQNKCRDEADVFFLPKLIYCEYCDKGYKSYEVLYNHKSKKKHYSYKLHPQMIENNNETVKEETLSQLPNQVEKTNENDSKPQTTENEVVKKKRGRKRKWPKIEVENRPPMEGYKYQCEKCAAVFDDIKTMETHSQNEHANIYMCQLCGQVLNSSKALAVHARAHQSLKPYVCDKCGRSYSQTSHLWQHMRFHQGIKPFACPHEGCEARYTIRPDLKDHIRKVHTRERPFKCSVCNKCFLTGSVYYQHRLIHTNDRRYGCEVCNKRFFRADALNNHRRIHTDERPYLCTVCGRSFRQKGDRNKHVRTQHIPV